MAPTTKTQKVTYLEIDKITYWDEFTWENVNAAFGPLIDCNFKGTFDDFSPRSREPRGEPGVKSLIIPWFKDFGKVLKKTARDIKRLQGFEAPVPSFTFEENIPNNFHQVWFRGMTKGVHYRPDINVICSERDENNAETGSYSIVAADIKTSSAFNPNELNILPADKQAQATREKLPRAAQPTSLLNKHPEAQRELFSQASTAISDDFDYLMHSPFLNLDQTDTHMYPCKQLSTYCVVTDTEYGFIITDRHLVPARVSKVRDPMGYEKPKIHMQVMPIEWDASGEDKLTVAFGIWALYAMSACGRPRNVKWYNEIQSDLKIWHKLGENKYKNSLSGFNTRRPPANAIIRDPPRSAGQRSRRVVPPVPAFKAGPGEDTDMYDTSDSRATIQDRMGSSYKHGVATARNPGVPQLQTPAKRLESANKRRHDSAEPDERASGKHKILKRRG
ncbi:Uu.00g096120.m01.CDS01 [Anthostomella pinea]|uniref:Uu.00g096120.m01.CDS01 n=1 Tax=Anthostomella pinea TaxID=933095 RepID=A0AAI8YF18_9PEZI|nr:Uu.00g096120.m01.CDS01 [Anthostomella pinea]